MKRVLVTFAVLAVGSCLAASATAAPPNLCAAKAVAKQV
jgi:hypothetical protein